MARILVAEDDPKILEDIVTSLSGQSMKLLLLMMGIKQCVLSLSTTTI